MTRKELEIVTTELVQMFREHWVRTGTAINPVSVPAVMLDLLTRLGDDHIQIEEAGNGQPNRDEPALQDKVVTLESQLVNAQARIKELEFLLETF